MNERMVVPANDLLVKWEGIWVKASVLKVLSEALSTVSDPEERDDLAAVTARAVKGKDLRSVEQIPARVRRRLAL